MFESFKMFSLVSINTMDNLDTFHQRGLTWVSRSQLQVLWINTILSFNINWANLPYYSSHYWATLFFIYLFFLLLRRKTSFVCVLNDRKLKNFATFIVGFQIGIKRDRKCCNPFIESLKQFSFHFIYIYHLTQTLQKDYQATLLNQKWDLDKRLKFPFHVEKIPMKLKFLLWHFYLRKFQIW